MSDRIAVMNGGQVEQIGSPREIYTRPQTAFVADFIGSLNVLELTIDELVGDYAVTRLDEGQRVVVTAGPGMRVGDAVRVATRPEQVRLSPASAASPDGGSFLRGRIAEVVFLGMYTQFHVDTRAGRVISHRMADEPLAALEPGTDVVLEWQAEDAALV